MLTRIPIRTPIPRSSEQDQDAPDDDQNSLLPRWLPDGSQRGGWVARLRADPGRAGAIALAVVAALAVLVTILTLVRDRPAPVMSAKLPPVEKASTASPRSSAAPAAGQPASPDDRGGQRGRPGAHSRIGHPGARCADRRCAAGRRWCGGRCGHHRIEHGPSASATASRSWSGWPQSQGSRRRSAARWAPARHRSWERQAPVSGSVKPKRVRCSTSTPRPSEQLDALPGVGPVTAAAIVAWRQAHGKFTSVDQLADVDGIGPARLEKLRPLVRV